MEYNFQLSRIDFYFSEIAFPEVNYMAYFT